MTEIESSHIDTAITTRRTLTELFTDVHLPQADDPLFSVEKSRLRALQMLVIQLVVYQGNTDSAATLWHLIEPHINNINDLEARQKLEKLEDFASQKLTGTPSEIEKMLGNPNKPGNPFTALCNHVGRELNTAQKTVLILASDTI